MTRARTALQQPVSIAPLVVFRIVFGLMMAVSTIRFMMLGWVDDHYLKPLFHFKYFGFAWVDVLPPFWMYAVHVLMTVAAVCVAIGLYYRMASVALFVFFTYTELIDLTYYLNHYYFVSLVCLLMALAPAHRWFSLDAVRRPERATPVVARGWIVAIQLQVAIVYTYAGLAKINSDWLLEALPLKIWLPAHDTLPVLGPLLRWPATAYVFSWFGMLYDCTIVLWLMNARARPWAYATVIVFHALTGMLFQIGVFPLVMVGAALIFFSERWHLALLNNISRTLANLGLTANTAVGQKAERARPLRAPMMIFFGLYFLFQLVFPWRYLLYPGNLFWTEEGYRFSWRVMLMEKAGTATFYVKDTATGREGVVVNSEFLNDHQEKQMAMQPDMILQFAHFLRDYYTHKGVSSPAVRAEVYVTLNARPSALLVDPAVDLTQHTDGWKHKSWILPYAP